MMLPDRFPILPRASIGVFLMITRSSRRWDLIAAVICIVSVPVIALGVGRIETAVEDVFQWLPDVSQARVDYDEFKTRFGSDDFLVVTWDGADIHDERVGQFASAVEESDTEGLVNEALDGPGLRDEIAFQSGESPATVARRLQGVFFGKEIAETCVLVNLTSKGMNSRSSVMELVRNTAAKVDGLTESDLVMAGYPYVGAHADTLVKTTFSRLLLPACFVSSLVAFFYLRHIPALLVILFGGGIAAGLSISAITLSGSKWGALSSIIPTLSYILSLSGGMHLIRYAGKLEKGWTVSDLFGVAWKPCATSAVTTIVGMLSLGQSSYPAVRQFGVYCAAGVAASLLCQLFVLPCLLYRFAGTASTRGGQSSPLWARLLYIARRRHVEILYGFTVVAVASLVGLTILRSDSQAENLFHHRSKVLTEMRQVEDKMGPLDQTELMVVFKDPLPENFHRRAVFIRELQEGLEATEEVSKAHSLADYLPSPPDGTSVRKTTRRVAIRRKVNGMREQLADDQLLAIGDKEEAWRISMRVPLAGETDFGGLEIAANEAAVQVKKHFFLAEENSGLRIPTFTYTGASHLFHEAQASLLADLGRNFAMAFVIITPVMIFCLQSFRLGLMAMVPNVTPALVVFGFAGILGVRVDIAIAMTACVALGIAVDDTAHFLIRFRDYGGSLKTPLPALELAFAQCGPAMLQTTMIAGIGMFVFSFSSLAAMGRFSLALVFLLFLAIFGNLVLLPPMVAPLQRLIRKRPPTRYRRAA